MHRSNRAHARLDASAEPRQERPGFARRMLLRPMISPRSISCAAREELRQAVLLELARHCQRQLGFTDELNQARNFVGGKPAAAKRQKVGLLDALTRLADDERGDYLIAMRVG